MNKIKMAMRIVLAYKKDQMIDYLKYKLKNDQKWCLQALKRIYEGQTEQQLQSEQTVEDNKVGFNSFDAKILSSIYLFYLQNGYLSSKQKNICFERMPKYSRQIIERVHSFDKGKLQNLMDKDKNFQDMLKQKENKKDKKIQQVFDF